MSNVGKFHDTTPALRPSGKTSALANESASECLKFAERPPTPPEQKAWRKSLKQEPGKIVYHPGQLPNLQPPGRTYGRQNFKDASAGDLMAQEPRTEVLQVLKARQENIYASVKTEPLGRSTRHRGHVLPEQTRQEGFMFGATVPKGSDAKAVLYPIETEDDSRGDAHQTYVKSHGDYNPGEQKRRGYNWDSTGIDPNLHRFGLHEKMAVGGGSEEVQRALDPSLTMGEGTAIVSKIVEDFKDFANDELGRCKNLGFGSNRPQHDHVYGVPSMGTAQGEAADEWGAGECLRGDYTGKGQEPDSDLGTTLRPGWRNEVRADKDAKRAFGTPSVRSDIAAPRVKSVADIQNYGDEPGAFTLIYPSKYAVKNVDEIDFVTPLPKAKLAEIVGIAFPEVSAADFERTWSHAQGGMMSVEQWRAVAAGMTRSYGAAQQEVHGEYAGGNHVGTPRAAA